MRRPLAALAALLLVLLAAVPASAGGWATITPDASGGEPREDETLVVGFTVLQHGQTPAPWVTATVVARNAITGEEFTVPATSTGADGHFTARVAFPEPGLWSWTVEISDLEAEPAVNPVVVRTASGARPVVDPAAFLGVVERTAAELRTELRGEYAGRLDALETQARSDRSASIAAMSRLDALTAERDALLARVERLESTPAGVPLLGVILLSVLAGAGAAFVMILLARPGAASPDALSPGAAATDGRGAADELAAPTP